MYIDGPDVKNTSIKDFLKKNWYWIVIAILCVALIISFVCLGNKKNEDTIDADVAQAIVETITEEEEPVNPTPTVIPSSIVITHNPTDESRNLGTDWQYDASRNMRYNPNVNMLFKVEGTGYTSVQWYVYSDHESKASNYMGVSGDTSNTISVMARTDMNGFAVYAKVSDNYGNTVTTTPAHMYITSQDKPVTTYYNISCSNCTSNYAFATPGTAVTVTAPAANYTIDVINTKGECIASSSNQLSFTFTMPSSDVAVYASIGGIQPNYYNLSVSSSDGGTVTSPLGNTFAEGENVILNCNSNDGLAHTYIVYINGEPVGTYDGTSFNFTMPSRNTNVYIEWNY